MDQKIRERIYAGWLAKLAGIRLGAPVEGNTYEEILEKVGEIDGYIGDLTRFAADDDSNGPMIFIRALKDHGTDVSASQIGETWLNYTPYEHGMFWWGGYGVSTEHTAYLNLSAGIPAPRSGSIAQNGSTVAEQIGGQIFIDTWGLVCPANPVRAAVLARRAASVSHDGNGIYGGIFVAAAVAAAFNEHDITQVIETGLSLIPDDCEYVRAFRAVRQFHRAHPDSWRDCFAFVKENFGYDRYPGNCHIIPNAAVMALSLYYGEGELTRTLNICCMCGWDTDCNCGNVATILGVMNGLEGIDRKWVEPINDGFAVSCVMGCLNWMDASWCADYLFDLACRMEGEEGSAFDENARAYEFSLPGATRSFEAEGGTVENAGGMLNCRADDGGAVLFRRTYRTPDFFMDDRYSPEFTPELFPGQSVCFSVSGEGVLATPFARTVSGEVFEGDQVFLQGGESLLRVTVPVLDSVCMERFGVRFSGRELVLKRAWTEGVPEFSLAFDKVPVEKHRSPIRGIRGFTRFKGLTDLAEGELMLTCSDRGECYTGDLGWKDYTLEAELCAKTDGECGMLVRVGGARRSVMVGFGEEKLFLRIRNGADLSTLAEVPFEGKGPVTLRAECRGDTVRVLSGGKELLRASVPFLSGAVGFFTLNGAHLRVRRMAVLPPDRI